MSEQLTAEQMREYVESRWGLTHHCDGSYRDYIRGTVLLQTKNRCWTAHESWATAYAYTKDREEEIRQLGEEIRVIEGCIAQAGSGVGSGAYVQRVARLYRTITRLEQALQELQRGMKPQEDAK
jgi:uncharacterized protein YukE